MTPAPDAKRDHGGDLDSAIARFGGSRDAWIDLSTGINPVPYPIPRLSPDAWTALPDSAAFTRLENAARAFWSIPPQAAVLAVPGASAAIAQLPRLIATGTVRIATPTYNEHAAAFVAGGWTVDDSGTDGCVAVHPNNPDGRQWSIDDINAPFRVVDESFCDVMPDVSLIAQSAKPGTVVLKSMGKFWGLAGMRLGFAIGDPRIIQRLKDALGPWQVSGPALDIGTEALRDFNWADDTRARLTQDAARLDQIMEAMEAVTVGGTSLFRLYEVADAQAAQDHLAKSHIWSRIFPYADNWLRLGLPAPDQWDRLTVAL